MTLISSNKPESIAILEDVLESYDCPAILVSAEYKVLATNSLYEQSFGVIDLNQNHRCFEVSHGYTVPCDQAGEDCPLQAAQHSGHRERVLHIHQTPRGKEHVDVEMLPIHNQAGELVFFVELLRTIPLVSGQTSNIEMAGSSEAFNTLLQHIARLGDSTASVLLQGESGTGKELVAKAIHEAGNRKSQALVTLECAGLTDSLFESELFGHVKGAFTGAHTNKKGLVEQANGGTLFLDEVGDIPLSMQVKLLRLIETGTFRPVGSTTVKTADFRLICASHKNLANMVEEGLFRQDLYYRINVFPIAIPNLDARREDIPAIAKNLLKQIDPKNHYHITDSALQLLIQKNYKGNIRELRNLLHRAAILSDTNLLEKRHVQTAIDSDIAVKTEKEINNEPRFFDIDEKKALPDLKSIQTQYLNKLMQYFGGDRKKVAATAGISLRSLYRKLQEVAYRTTKDD